MDKPVVSVITAAAPGVARLPFLEEAYSNLVAQILPSDATWEWLIEVDGDSGQEARAAFAPDPRVAVGSHTHQVGATVSRNLALARASGHWLLLMDDDDLLPPRALGALLGAVNQEPRAWWAVGRGENLYADGRREPWPHRFPSGFLPAGEMTRRTLDFGHVPLHTMSGLFRRDLILAIGGWSALMRDEDSALWLLASHLRPGVVIDELTYIYRRWPNQTITKAWFNDPGLIRASRTLIAARIEALEALGLSSSPPPAVARDWSGFIEADPVTEPAKISKT